MWLRQFCFWLPVVMVSGCNEQATEAKKETRVAIAQEYHERWADCAGTAYVAQRIAEASPGNGSSEVGLSGMVVDYTKRALYEGKKVGSNEADIYKLIAKAGNDRAGKVMSTGTGMSKETLDQFIFSPLDTCKRDF